MKSRDDLISFWTKQYYFCKEEVDKIDNGIDSPPDTILGAEKGQRQHCVEEANIAVERLNDLGQFELQKIA